MAVERPHEYLSIALDGTDQLPKGLPQFAEETTDDVNLVDRLKLKFTVAKIHGIDTCLYDHMENVSGDPNLTVEVLQRSLKKAEQVLGKLPSTLYLQMDNCFRENKNSFVVNWLGTLVERGLFPRGVFVSFLPSGHTHNECDQIGSRLSVAVRKKTIYTREELYALARQCYHNIRIERIRDVADSKKYLNPDGNVAWTNSPFKRCHNINEHQHFKIAMEMGGLTLRTRNTCKDTHWSLSHFLLKKPTEKSLRDLCSIEHPGTTVVDLSPALKEKITTCLNGCKTRVLQAGADKWEQLVRDRDELFNQVPKPTLHWADGGRFKQEDDDDAEFLPVEDIQAIQFEHLSGLYDHGASKNQNLQRLSHPTALLLQNYIAVATAKDDDPLWPKGSVCSGVRIALITGLLPDSEHPVQSKVEVMWLVSLSRDKVLGTAVWRPTTDSNRVAVIPLDNILVTWPRSGWSKKMTLRKYWLAIIRYKLKMKNNGIQDWNRMPAMPLSSALAPDDEESVARSSRNKTSESDGDRAARLAKMEALYNSICQQVGQVEEDDSSEDEEEEEVDPGGDEVEDEVVCEVEPQLTEDHNSVSAVFNHRIQELVQPPSQDRRNELWATLETEWCEKFSQRRRRSNTRN